MKKSILYSLHGFVWFSNLSIIFLVSMAANVWADGNALNGLKIVAGLFFWSIAIFYLGNSLIVPKLYSKQKYFAFFITIVGVISFFPLIPHLDKVASAISGNGWMGYSLAGYVQVVFLTLFICSCGIFFRLFIDWIDNQQKRKELDNEKLKTKMMVLVNQSNPHFIFNVLNNIDSLIISKPAKASETISKLSQLLRYVYSNSESDKVLLSLETEYIENYIELQKLRLDSEVNVRFEKPQNAKDIKIVPMLFLPFIENAFKHGIIENDHPIKIVITTKNNKLFFECQNSYNINGKSEQTESGFGISNIIKRLDLLYPSNYALNIEKEKGIYVVSLTLEF
jgi:two-component system LytT family sensor kinase